MEELAVNPFTGDDMFARAHADCGPYYDCLGPCEERICPRCDPSPAEPSYCAACDWNMTPGDAV
jgi:hypothetical protein